MPNRANFIPVEEILARRYEALGATFTLREAAQIVTQDSGREVGHDDIHYWQEKELIGKPPRPRDIARGVILGLLRGAGYSLQEFTAAVQGGPQEEAMSARIINVRVRENESVPAQVRQLEAAGFQVLSGVREGSDFATEQRVVTGPTHRMDGHEVAYERRQRLIERLERPHAASIEFDAKVKRAMAADTGMKEGDAVKAVQRDNPELAQALWDELCGKGDE